MTKMERACSDQLVFPFLLCQVSKGIDLSWDAWQIEWYPGLEKPKIFHKRLVIRLLSGVFAKLSDFSRQKLTF